MSFTDLAESIRREELAHRRDERTRAALEDRLVPTAEATCTSRDDVCREAASCLRLALGLLTPPTSQVVSGHPNRVVKEALRARGWPQAHPVTRSVFSALNREVDALHPDWVRHHCLERLAADDGLPAFRRAILRAAERLERAKGGVKA